MIDRVPCGGDLLDLAVVVIGDVQVAGAVHRDTVGIIQRRLCRGARGRCPGGADAGDDRQGALRGDLLDLIVERVGDVQVAGGWVHRHIAWIAQLRAARRAWGRCPGGAGAGDDRQGALGGDLLDPAVVVVGDVQVAGVWIRCHPVRLVQSRAGGGAGGRCPGGAGAGDDRQGALGGDLLDLVVERVGDVQISSAIDRHPGRIAQRRVGRAAGGRRAIAAGARGDRQGAPGGDLLDLAVVVVGDVQVAGGRIHRHVARVVQRRAGRGPRGWRPGGAGAGEDRQICVRRRRRRPRGERQTAEQPGHGHRAPRPPRTQPQPTRNPRDHQPALRSLKMPEPSSSARNCLIIEPQTPGCTRETAQQHPCGTIPMPPIALKLSVFVTALSRAVEI